MLDFVLKFLGSLGVLPILGVLFMRSVNLIFFSAKQQTRDGEQGGVASAVPGITPPPPSQTPHSVAEQGKATAPLLSRPHIQVHPIPQRSQVCS